MSNWHTEETYKSMIQISMLIMRFILIANGGAAIALLTFIGNSTTNSSSLAGFRLSMFFFLFGVFMGGVMTLFSYVTQLTLFRENMGRNNKDSHGLPLKIAGLCALGGVFSFALGAWIAVNSF